MKRKTVLLAAQLLETVPKDEIDELVQLLQYYNRFPEHQRVQAMKNGSKQPKNESLEKEVISETRSLTKTAGSQNVYVTTNQGVCSCCGR